ncbi:nuclease-related domain-containing protein [Photobacterium damselae]|uniref:nuclease-related domain-containing protein n=1 Tax=Photobacterium damselae TaxID=38293 RepID=UPI004068F128
MSHYFMLAASAITDPLALTLFLLALGTFVCAREHQRKRGKKHKRAHQASKRRRKPKTHRLEGADNGSKFESELTNSIANALPAEGIVFTDIVIEDDLGLTQIDIIVILPSGIWVIEAKDMSGLILANQYGYKWTQVLAGGNYKQTFQNPIRQNHRHVKALEFITGHLAESIESLVVFNDRCKFGDKGIPDGVLVGIHKATQHIEQLKTRPVQLSFEQMEQLCGKIAFAKLAGSQIKEKHIQDLHDRHRDNDKGD